MEVEDFIEEYYGLSLEDYAQETLMNQCVQELLVEAEGLTVTDEEYQAEIQTYIDDYGYEDEEEIMEYYTEEEIRSDLLDSKLMTNLLKVGPEASGMTSMRIRPDPRPLTSQAMMHETAFEPGS